MRAGGPGFVDEQHCRSGLLLVVPNEGCGVTADTLALGRKQVGESGIPTFWRRG
jgi:hypothetical protein